MDRKEYRESLGLPEAATYDDELTALRARVAELEELLRRTAARATEGPQINSEKLTREDPP